MNELNTLIFTATPLVFAVVGETITEKAGVINLSMEGSLMLSAMAGFVIAFETNSLLLGFLAGAAPEVDAVPGRGPANEPTRQARVRNTP